METTYCVICCGEYPHIGDDFLCEKCDNPASSGIIERDEQIENLAYENKMMAKKLEELGFTQEQISSICTGGTEDAVNFLS